MGIRIETKSFLSLNAGSEFDSKEMAMRNALLIGASALALGIAGSANGADLHFKAPPAPAPLAFSWTGCYVGGHVGWGWGSTKFRDHSTSNVFSTGGGGPT